MSNNKHNVHTYRQTLVTQSALTLTLKRTTTKKNKNTNIKLHSANVHYRSSSLAFEGSSFTPLCTSPCVHKRDVGTPIKANGDKKMARYKIYVTDMHYIQRRSGRSPILFSPPPSLTIWSKFPVDVLRMTHACAQVRSRLHLGTSAVFCFWGVWVRGAADEVEYDKGEQGADGGTFRPSWFSGIKLKHLVKDQRIKPQWIIVDVVQTLHSARSQSQN